MHCKFSHIYYLFFFLITQIGGSGVLVSPLVYIFDEEPPRWRRLLKELGLESKY
jgi:hypothetical protein